MVSAITSTVVAFVKNPLAPIWYPRSTTSGRLLEEKRSEGSSRMVAGASVRIHRKTSKPCFKGIFRSNNKRDGDGYLTATTIFADGGVMKSGPGL